MKKIISIPFLFYHSVTHLDKGLDGINPESFEMHMTFLKRQGYHAIFLDDMARFLKGEGSLPEKSVAISFDDGYLDNWLFAYPILKKYRIRATIFITTYLVEKEPHILRSHQEAGERYLSWTELKAMEESGLIDVQSHMHTHSDNIKTVVKKGKMNEAEMAWLKMELTKSKELIAHQLEKSCDYICWPWGLYNKTFITLARECGYLGAVTSKRGANCLGSSVMEMKRFYVRPKWGGGKIWFSHRLKIFSNAILAKVYAVFVSALTFPIRKIFGIGF